MEKILVNFEQTSEGLRPVSVSISGHIVPVRSIAIDFDNPESSGVLRLEINMHRVEVIIKPKEMENAHSIDRTSL